MRLFELATLLLLGAVAFDGVTAALPRCASIRTRKEIRNLTDGERERFLNAIKTLLDKNPRPNAYDAISNKHYNARQRAHGTAWFFPWHRGFIRDFEIMLQAVDPNIMLPYWDWTIDSQAPEASPVFGPSWFGGNGQAADKCVTTGKFAGWKPYYPSQSCLKRDFNSGFPGSNRISAFFSNDVIQNIIENTRTYDSFRLAFEPAPHGHVHVNIGEDMSTMYSPNDPIFWIHHAYVDKVWADWQAKNSNNFRNYGGPTFPNGAPAVSTETMAPLTYTVNELFDTKGLCYTYAEYVPDAVMIDMSGLMRRAIVPPAPAKAPATTKAPASTPTKAPASTSTKAPASTPTKAPAGAPTNATSSAIPGVDITDTPTAPNQAPAPVRADDRTELVSLRIPSALPEAWIKANGLDVNAVRQSEKSLSTVIAGLNAKPGFVSFDAPINQPQILRSMAAANPKLVATKPGHKLTVQISQKSASNSSLKSVISQVKSKLSLAKTPVPSKAPATPGTTAKPGAPPAKNA